MKLPTYEPCVRSYVERTRERRVDAGRWVCATNARATGGRPYTLTVFQAHRVFCVMNEALVGNESALPVLRPDQRPPVPLRPRPAGGD